MRRFAFLLLATLCALSFGGCADKQQDVVPAPAPIVGAPTVSGGASVPAAVGNNLPEDAEVDAGATIYTFGDLQVPVPTEYLDALVIETDLEAWNTHWTPLISFSERASVEAGQLDHPGEDWGDGWLCTVARLDRIGFEDWASSAESGMTLFAKDENGIYYLMMRPTDVRLYRAGDRFDDAGLDEWETLNVWADALGGEIVARSGLTPYDAADLFTEDYTYGGEHVELGCRFPGELKDLVILVLSQPARQGEGGLWCVERYHEVYSEYDFTDTHLVFPAALGVDMTAEDYYAQLQEECDAGQHPELLTPQGAALDYARRDAVKWMFGEDVSATDFEYIDSLG